MHCSSGQLTKILCIYSNIGHIRLISSATQQQFDKQSTSAIYWIHPLWYSNWFCRNSDEVRFPFSALNWVGCRNHTLASFPVLIIILRITSLSDEDWSQSRKKETKCVIHILFTSADLMCDSQFVGWQIIIFLNLKIALLMRRGWIYFSYSSLHSISLIWSFPLSISDVNLQLLRNLWDCFTNRLRNHRDILD